MREADASRVAERVRQRFPGRVTVTIARERTAGHVVRVYLLAERRTLQIDAASETAGMLDICALLLGDEQEEEAEETTKRTRRVFDEQEIAAIRRAYGPYCPHGARRRRGAPTIAELARTYGANPKTIRTILRKEEINQ